jgi:hypothetical protein
VLQLPLPPLLPLLLLLLLLLHPIWSVRQLIWVCISSAGTPCTIIKMIPVADPR